MTEDFAFTIQKIETEQQLNLVTTFLGPMLILSEVISTPQRRLFRIQGGRCNRKLVLIKAQLNVVWDEGSCSDLSTSWPAPSETAGPSKLFLVFQNLQFLRDTRQSSQWLRGLFLLLLIWELCKPSNYGLERKTPFLIIWRPISKPHLFRV